MKIINLTPHEVVVSNGFVHVTFPPSGNVARVDKQVEKRVVNYQVNGDVRLSLPVESAPKVRVTNLPKQKAGTYYIVSGYVAQAVKRDDLLAPLTDTSAVRDEQGNVLSVKGFLQYCEHELLEGVRA